MSIRARPTRVQPLPSRRTPTTRSRGTASPSAARTSASRLRGAAAGTTLRSRTLAPSATRPRGPRRSRRPSASRLVSFPPSRSSHTAPPADKASSRRQWWLIVPVSKPAAKAASNSYANQVLLAAQADSIKTRERKIAAQKAAFGKRSLELDSDVGHARMTRMHRRAVLEKRASIKTVCVPSLIACSCLHAANYATGRAELTGLDRDLQFGRHLLRDCGRPPPRPHGGADGQGDQDARDQEHGHLELEEGQQGAAVEGDARLVVCPSVSTFFLLGSLSLRLFLSLCCRRALCAISPSLFAYHPALPAVALCKRPTFAL